jgi:plastocyanin
VNRRSVTVGVRRPLALAAAVAGLALALLLGGEQEGSYVVTAIDYHFHDAHPTFPIGPGRDLVVKNAGRNVHNVTIPALDYSEDVRPGGQLTIPDVAVRFGAPGAYSFLCLYHQDRGMTGSIVIASQ